MVLENFGHDTGFSKLSLVQQSPSVPIGPDQASDRNEP
jgi:hypothetical protein